MMRGLLAKELRQHGFTLAFLFLIVVGGLVFIGANGMLRRASGGGIAAVQFLHMTFVPLAGLVLGQILIATEFRQKTQLFLLGTMRGGGSCGGFHVLRLLEPRR